MNANLSTSTKEFFETVKNRRTIYAIGKDVAVGDEAVLEIIREAVKYTPTAFNSQSGRIVVLQGKEHDKLWAFTEDILKGIVPAEGFAKTKEKLESFRAGRGTVLFFEDQQTVQALQQKFPLYKDNFPVWSLQGSGMLQYIVWTALESEGLGVSLQHYNPLIDEKVHAEWNLPQSWLLLGEMPFGSKLAAGDDKTFLPVEERVKVFS